MGRTARTSAVIQAELAALMEQGKPLPTSLLDEFTAATHVERCPDGCPGWCDACIERLRPRPVTCPCCGNARLYEQPAGRVQQHSRKVPGRRNYKATWQTCEGGGVKVRRPPAEGTLPGGRR